jgi:integrase
MAAPMDKTNYPGIYRRGSRWVATWYAGGRQKKKSARTQAEARKLRAAMLGDVARGEFDEPSRVGFGEYAADWIERYHGRGKRGFRESTREEYRRSLQVYAFPFFDGQVAHPGAPRRALKLSEVRPPHIAAFVGWLADERAQAEHEYALARAEWKRRRGEGLPAREPLRQPAKRLADSSIRNALNPVRAALATAVREGMVRHNPTRDVALPHRPRVDEDDEDVRALSREQLAALLALVPERHRLLFRFLASTGLRISELVGLQWRHLQLDGSHAHVKVRRAIVRGRVEPPKSRHGKRDVPLPFELVSDLRQHRKATEWPGEDDPVFPSLVGKPLDPGNLRRRVLAPAAEEAGVPSAGFHVLRHTCATLLFARGANAVQVQRWLGHGSPSFTLSVYVHLLDGDLGEPLDLASELRVATKVASHPNELGRNGQPTSDPEPAL